MEGDASQSDGHVSAVHRPRCKKVEEHGHVVAEENASPTMHHRAPESDGAGSGTHYNAATCGTTQGTQRHLEAGVRYCISKTVEPGHRPPEVGTDPGFRFGNGIDVNFCNQESHGGLGGASISLAHERQDHKDSGTNDQGRPQSQGSSGRKNLQRKAWSRDGTAAMDTKMAAAGKAFLVRTRQRLQKNKRRL